VEDRIKDLGAKDFPVRQRAQKQLTDWAKANQLNQTDLENLREAADSSDPEIRRRAGQVLSEWGQANPNLLEPLKDALDSFPVEIARTTRRGVSSIELDGVASETKAGNSPEADKISQAYTKAQNDLTNGRPDKVAGDLKALQKTLKGLNPQQWEVLGFSKDEAKKILDSLDSTIKKAEQAAKKIDKESGKCP
jgi:hypothetical protein